MAANVKVKIELDARIQKIIDEEFADFEKYLPMPQDKKVYERKRKEYWDKINARVREELNNDGRADNSVNATAND